MYGLSRLYRLDESINVIIELIRRICVLQQPAIVEIVQRKPVYLAEDIGLLKYKVGRHHVEFDRVREFAATKFLR